MSTRPRTVLAALLERVEWLGNKLPDPVFLFVLATAAVMLLSAIGSGLGWSVQPVRAEAAVPAAAGQRAEIRLVPQGEPIRARSLLTSQGTYWLLANAVRNFINFAPLGVVLVSTFGIGLAERVGMFGTAMRQLAGVTPATMLAPMVVFLGISSHVASDAGYIVLPPLAAGLFAAARKPPLAGLAAAFAGVAGGFSANLLVGATDSLIAPLTERGARVLDANYSVLPTCNWYFLAASSVLLVLAGWWVTSRVTEPRMALVASDGAGEDVTKALTAPERRGMRWAWVAGLIGVAGIVALILVPGAPLNGPMPAAAPAFGPIPSEAPATPAPGVLPPRWSQAVVPLIFVGFLLPGVAYGVASGTLRKVQDASDAFVHAMKVMAPVVAVSFFAAQFIECLRYSRLDVMLAQSGGRWLAAADMPWPLMLVAVVGLTMVINLLVASMSAKWTALAVVLVPMLMMSGVSPELTQAAYRVGDSITNTVTPLNGYMILILAAGQRYRKDLGLGHVVAMMLPYAVVFGIVWMVLLLVWVWLGLPLGPGAPLWYVPGQ